MRRYIVFCCFIVCVSVPNAFALEESPEFVQTNDVNKDFIFPKDRTNKVRIIGGKVATPHAYPYQAALTMTAKSGQRLFCGGSLITPNAVLTAAHCLVGAWRIDVQLGFHNLSELDSAKNRIITTTTYHYHKKYNGANFMNDIGVVLLPENVTLTDTIKLIPVDTSSDSHSNQRGLVTGWGVTNQLVPRVSAVLRYAEGNILSNTVCKMTNNMYQVLIQKTMICVKSLLLKGVCSGDSGGPLVVNGVQVGIVSFSPVICGTSPAVFTRVSQYSDWIRQYTVINSSSAANNNCINTFIFFLIIIAYYILA